MNKGIFSTAMVWLLLGMQVAKAQTLTPERSLDPVTVTSSLIEKRSSETGRSISIIKGETFSKLPVHSIDELLKYVPGVEVFSRGPQGSQSDITIRGGTFQQVLIVLDGLRLNDPNTGHFSGYIPIAPAEIDRIEVLKGPSSAIYGADAVGGVIHIITKAFNAAQQKNTTTLNAQVAAGEYGLLNTSAGVFYKKNKLAVGAGLLSNHATGVPQRGIRGYFHNTAVSAGIQYSISPAFDFSYRAAYDSRDFAAQNFYTTFASDTATEKVTTWWHQARLAYHKGGSKLSVDAGYKVLNDKFAFNTAAAANHNTSIILQTQLLYQQWLTDHTTLVAGFNFQQKSIVSNDRGNHQLNTAAPFATIVQKIGNVVTLQPSVRIEYIGNNPAEFLPQLTASARLGNVQLRASGGKTIRDADFTERYNNYNKTLVKSGSVGYAALTPERSWSYEAGFDWFLKNNLKFSTTAFQRLHTKLIDWVTTPYADMPRKDNLQAGSTYALAKNIAEVNTTGVEADLQYLKKINAMQSLTATAGIIWAESKSTEAQPSFYIASHAKWLANISAVYQLGRSSLSLTGLYKSRQPQQASAINATVTSDYCILNARAAYGFIQNRLQVFVQVDNVFDRRYSDLLGSPMPGRWAQGGLQFNFSKP